MIVADGVAVDGDDDDYVDNADELTDDQFAKQPDQIEFVWKLQ